jgi:hypothetical protein
MGTENHLNFVIFEQNVTQSTYDNWDHDNSFW